MGPKMAKTRNWQKPYLIGNLSLYTLGLSGKMPLCGPIRPSMGQKSHHIKFGPGGGFGTYRVLIGVGRRFQGPYRSDKYPKSRPIRYLIGPKKGYLIGPISTQNRVR